MPEDKMQDVDLYETQDSLEEYYYIEMHNFNFKSDIMSTLYIDNQEARA